MVPPQRAARRSTGARRPPAQPIGTLPGNEGGGREPTSQRPMNIREVPVCSLLSQLQGVHSHLHIL